MGAPSSLTADERQYVADLADHICIAVEADEATPTEVLKFRADRAKLPQDLDWTLLALAQEIRRLRKCVGMCHAANLSHEGEL